MSEKANPVKSLPSESEEKEGDVQAETQIARLPWTSSSAETMVMPWQIGHEKSSSQSSNGGSPFAIPAGPMPEDIPGFPFPDDIPGFPIPSVTDKAGSSSQPANGAIKPLSRLSRATASRPSPSQAQPEASVQTRHQQDQTQTQVIAPIEAPQPPKTSVPAARTSEPQPQPSSPGINLASLLNSATLNAQSGNLSTDQLATGYLDPLEVMFHEPRNIQETGLNQGMIFDLVLKTMYYTSYMSGQEISSALRLPFYGIIDQIINLLKKEQLCEVSGAAGLGEAGYQYVLTVKGMERAHQVMLRSKYVGPAPVPLAKYIDVFRLQGTKKPVLNRQTVENALQGFIISEDLTNQVGAAVNAGKSLFLFGAPGNGKTLLTERIAKMLGGNIIIPYALEADGQIIQLFDLNSHNPAVPQGLSVANGEADISKAELSDRRWLKIQRPVVVVGGELTMAALDLIYNDNVGFYEAPVQLKANGGLFLIDDFGRQQASPQALLNRWIVPLEKSIDFLTLKTGKKLQVPFDLFLVLSTNLQPEDLIDEAFLRRIQNKLFVPDPTPQQFYEIFLGQCRMMSVPFDQAGFTHLVNKHYVEAKRPFRASQPRDLLRQLLGIAKYRNVPPELTPQLLDAACSTYFVTIKPK